MPKRKGEGVDYGEYRYKGYVWHEDGRENLPDKRRKKAVKADTACKKKKKRHEMKMDAQGAFVAIFMLFSFSLTFLVANLAGKGSFLSVLDKNQPSEYMSYYCVTLGGYERESEAASLSQEIMKLGAAGYMLTEKGKYYPVACAYERESDANSVAERMYGYEASVVKLTVEAPALSWCKTADKDTVENVLSYAKTTFSKLYDVSVKLDGGDISNSQATNIIKLLHNEIVKLTTTLDKTTISKDDFNLIKLKAEITACLAMLNSLTSSNGGRNDLLAEIRYVCVAVIVGYKNLTVNI